MRGQGALGRVPEAPSDPGGHVVQAPGPGQPRGGHAESYLKEQPGGMCPVTRPPGGGCARGSRFPPPTLAPPRGRGPTLQRLGRARHYGGRGLPRQGAGAADRPGGGGESRHAPRRGAEAAPPARPAPDSCVCAAGRAGPRRRRGHDGSGSRTRHGPRPHAGPEAWTGQGGGGKSSHSPAPGPGPYLEGVQGLHQAGELGGVPLLQIVVLLPGVPAGGLPVRQDAVLEPGQAPGAVGVRQVPPSCGQDPARTGVSVTPWAPSRGGRIRGPAPEGVETSSSLGTALGQAQRAGAVTANHHTRPTGTCRCPARRTAWAGSRRRA